MAINCGNIELCMKRTFLAVGCSERSWNPANPRPCGTNPVRGGELRSDPRGSSDESQPMDEMTDDREALDRRWVDRHHVDLRLQLYVPKEESFPIPLQHTCVVRAARRTLNVLQQSRTDDYRNVDADRNLSESWTSFTQFTTLSEKNVLTDACGPRRMGCSDTKARQRS